MNTKKIYCVLARYDAQTEKHLAGIQQSLYDQGFVGIQTKDIFMHVTLGTFSPSDEDLLISSMKRAAESSSFDVPSATSAFSAVERCCSSRLTPATNC